LKEQELMSRKIELPPYEHVLIVDHDNVDVYISLMAMKEANFADNVVSKSSAKDALRYMVDLINDKKKLPDLVFLEWNLPEETSETFLKEFKKLCKKMKHESTIIILSNLVYSEFIMEKLAKEHTMIQAFLEKPLSTDLLGEL
jgi:response regulator RpfG family c-di-GMP phosphodiesterase